MFDPNPDRPRVFGLPPGCAFPAQFVQGLRHRMAGAAPQDWARLRILVNTERMGREIAARLATGPAMMLPRILSVSQLAGPQGAAFGLFDLPPERPPLRRRLTLAQLVEQLLLAEPELAPRSAAYPLADSLALLLDEMQDEGVSAEALRSLDLRDHSDHWARALRFVSIVLDYAAAETGDSDPAERLATYVDHLTAAWADNPPATPILLVGSTGSRGTTARLMQAVARLPQGAVVLPGFDFDQPQAIWDRLAAPDADLTHAQDHPQDRLARVMQRLDLRARDVAPWSPNLDGAVSTPRSRLLSLALRPAPVTDQWRQEGPKLGDLQTACAGLTLVEADSPRAEAAAIALRMRRAIRDNQTVALITPDRMLTRQVTAALDRWRILPDDSAGRPLALSPPGRLMRQVAALSVGEVSSEALVALLKHPLTASGSGQRNLHLLCARDLELWLRRQGVVSPTPAHLRAWTQARDAAPPDPKARQAWTDWLCAVLEAATPSARVPLADRLTRYLNLLTRVANGTETGTETGELWLEKAGQEARKLIDGLQDEAGAGGAYTAQGFADLLTDLLQAATVRDAVQPHENVLILGPREAREQTADLVILGGLNDGVWPAQPAPDPWLNRQMRQQAGLTLPDRRIGLQAHDFQQAACAPLVVLTRARRDAEAETVPSRWLNRLTNLLGGLGPDGEHALAEMRARGQALLADLTLLETPRRCLKAATRPEPIPPMALRPKAFSFTDVERLRRDPYAIYAKRVLGLRPLDDLRLAPDARLRGQMLHKVFEAFTKQTWDGLPDNAGEVLRAAAQQVLVSGPVWKAAERQWLTHIDQIADGFLHAEAQRRQIAQPFVQECDGTLALPEGGQLFGRADRIDRTPDGALVIYDYKSGAPPSPKVIDSYNRQLHLEAAVAEAGGFKDVPAAPVDRIAYLGLHKDLKTTEVSRAKAPDFVAQSWAAFLTLYRAYLQPDKGYLSRRAVQGQLWAGDYDHLARHGEWDDTDPATPEAVA